MISVTAQNVLRSQVAAMNSVELALCASATGIPVRILIAWAENKTALSRLSIDHLGRHVLVGQYFEKKRRA